MTVPHARIWLEPLAPPQAEHQLGKTIIFINLSYLQICPTH